VHHVNQQRAVLHSKKCFKAVLQSPDTHIQSKRQFDSCLREITGSGVKKRAVASGEG